jgi:hypothetical protein
MIGGGMAYIDDKSRGVHEAYLVTPITKFELVLAMNIAGTLPLEPAEVPQAHPTILTSHRRVSRLTTPDPSGQHIGRYEEEVR